MAQNLSQDMAMLSDAPSQAGSRTATYAAALPTISDAAYPSPVDSAYLPVDEENTIADDRTGSVGGGGAGKGVPTSGSKFKPRKRASKVEINPKEHAKLVKEAAKLKQLLEDSQKSYNDRTHQLDLAQQEILRGRAEQQSMVQELNRLKYELTAVTAAKDAVTQELEQKKRYWAEFIEVYDHYVAGVEALLQPHRSTALNASVTTSTLRPAPSFMAMGSLPLDVSRHMPIMPPMMLQMRSQTMQQPLPQVTSEIMPEPVLATTPATMPETAATRPEDVFVDLHWPGFGEETPEAVAAREFEENEGGTNDLFE